LGFFSGLQSHQLHQGALPAMNLERWYQDIMAAGEHQQACPPPLPAKSFSSRRQGQVKPFNFFISFSLSPFLAFSLSALILLSLLSPQTTSCCVTVQRNGWHWVFFFSESLLPTLCSQDFEITLCNMPKSGNDCGYAYNQNGIFVLYLFSTLMTSPKTGMVLV
jgi:hypothetical protein